MRRALLVLSLAISLGLLVFFKYTNSLVDSAFSILRLVGQEPPPVLSRIVVPLGISFYAFQTISYVVDVYRRKIPAERRLLDYALFIMFAQGATTILLGVPVSTAFRSGYLPPIAAAVLAHMHALERRRGVRYVDCRARMPDAWFRST